MTYQMLVSDLDGTIGNDAHQISEENKKAAKALIESGVKLVLCSGRTPVSLEAILKEMQVNSSYIVGFNGCSVREVATNETIYEKKVSLETTKALIDEIKSFDVTIGVYVSESVVFAQREKDLVDKVDAGGPLKFEVHEDLNSALTADIHKILLIAPRPELDKVYAYLADKIQGKCNMVFTNTTLLELIPLDGNKGKGLKFLAERLNMPLSAVVSCGDNYNDIELLQTAGMGIAVANAVEPLKKVADKITKSTNNEHAFAEIVKFIIETNGGSYEI